MDVTFEYIKTNGVTLHTALAGSQDGELVVLLHGFPEFWYGWKHQIEALAAEGYWVVAPDQRGYHLSSKPEGVAAYEMNELRDDILGLITQLGRKQAVIIGHDWGGAIGWHLAATRPEVVRYFIPINIPHPGVMPKVMGTHPVQILQSSYMLFFQLPTFPERTMQAKQFDSLKQALLKTSKNETFSETDLQWYEKAWSQPGALTGMLNWYRAMNAETITELMRRNVHVPVHMLWGIGDQFLSTALAKESMTRCTNGELTFIGEATHWVQHEQPEVINHLIKKSLQAANQTNV
ncbi:alpha/beta fold hydrolase [Salsuginibacillus kocurii]|uniref:alpha/beta fold hydrolase n=1 Tax=Salsuginibacillus kocurii TaxID=427078 RepID=UPI000366D594|nr:alpha/beta hydrolase [Salsuginibacillus kocurii]